LQIGWLIWLVDYARNGVTDTLKDWYAGHEVKASACIECGECLARCPFGVDIMAKLRTAVEVFEEKAA
jgi:predicted aldo/keto reductase-like oxidoreductase